jgi:protein phosphatase 1G
LKLFHNCLAPNTVGDGTGCDNMTAIIVKFKPNIFEVGSSDAAEVNLEVQKSSSGKRPCEENEATPTSQKKPKIDDDLTPAAVDTSTA